MPWYYAGPDAQPVGPLSLEELQRRRAEGAFSPETYVIEHTGAADPNRAWKPYRELFPAAAPITLPPFPVGAVPSPGFALLTSASTGGYVYPPAPAVTGTPIALPVPGSPGSARFGYPDATLRPGQPSGRTTNGACRWGMILGVFSLPGLFCLVGPLLAIFSLILSLVGFLQVQARREQTGRGLAVAGALCSLLSLLITLAVVVAVYHHSNFSFQTQTTTETTNSDTQ